MTQTPDTPPSDPTGGPDSEPSPGQSPGPSPSGKPATADNPLRASRTSGFYTAVIALGIVLVLLIIFIVQNTGDADVHYFGFDGTAPQAVLLLIALAAGIFLTATASTLRLLQVRRRVKRERKARA